MKCPVCKTSTLLFVTLNDELPAQQCSNCHGNWISANTYMSWLRARPGDLPEKPSGQPLNPVWENHETKLCPQCGRLLRRFQIFPQADFHLDRCSHCNGIWFDAHEWEALVERNLHDNLHEFFTQPWQNSLRASETHARMQAIYLQKFGAQDYEKVKEIRAWLEANEHKGMLLAYLLADDPYRL